MRFGDIREGIEAFAEVLGIMPGDIEIRALGGIILVPAFAEFRLSDEQDLVWKNVRDRVHCLSWWNGGANGYYFKDEAALSSCEMKCLESRRKYFDTACNAEAGSVHGSGVAEVSDQSGDASEPDCGPGE